MLQRLKSFGFVVLVVGAVSLTVRARNYHAFVSSPLAGTFSADQAYYRSWGLRIASGKWIPDAVFEQTPLYAYLLGGAYRCGLSDNAIIGAQYCIGVLTSLLVCICARRLFGCPTALVAGLLAALYGPFVFYEGMIHKSFLSPLLTVGALYCALRYADAGRVRWVWAAAFAIGLSCLVRENHILMVVPLIAWVWRCGSTKRDPTPTSARRYHVLAIPVAILLTLLPSTLANYAAAREWVAVTSGGGEVLYIAHGPSAQGFYKCPAFVVAFSFREHDDFRREANYRTGRKLSRAEASRYWARQALTEISPRRTLWLTFQKAVILVNDFEVPDSEDYAVSRNFLSSLRYLPTFGWMMGLGLVGMVLALREPPARLALGMVAAHVLSVLILYNLARFRLGMMPVWCIFSAHAAVWLANSFHTSGRRIQAVFGAVVALLLTNLAYLPASDFRAHQAAKTEYLHGIPQQQKAARRALDTLERDPDDANAHNQLATAMMELGRVDEAESHYRSAVKLDSDFADARYRFGTALILLGRMDDGLEQLSKAVALEPNDIAARLELAQNLRRQSPEKAISHLQAIVRFDPGHASARRRLIDLLISEARTADALAQLADAVQQGYDPASRDQLVRLVNGTTLGSANLTLAVSILVSIADQHAKAGSWNDAEFAMLEAAELARRGGDHLLATKIEQQLRSSQFSMPPTG